MNKKTIFSSIIYILLFLGLLSIYAYYIEPYNLKIKEYKVESNRLPSNFNGYKIIHISDIKYGSTTNINIIKDMVNNINKLKPNLIIFTGDLLSKNISTEEQETLINELNKINSKYNLYYVNGDKDKELTDKILSKTSFKKLSNEQIKIYYNDKTPITLTGLDKDLNLDNLFNEEDKTYNIVLSHYPDNFYKINNNIDLYLAGHSLGGQIRLPFIGSIYKFKNAKKLTDSYYQINNTEIHISNGIGTTKLPIRLLNSPSINFYRLYTN